jgi:lysophospholipase L1-like esterase
MRTHVWLVASSLALASGLSAGCSGSSGQDGAASSGGVANTGGAPSSGGATSAGGATGAGGQPGSGGTGATGGARSGGGAPDGGGVVSSGGSAGAGGALGSGGRSTAGGGPGSGGVPAAGGGGAPGTGGGNPTGGRGAAGGGAAGGNADAAAGAGGRSDADPGSGGNVSAGGAGGAGGAISMGGATAAGGATGAGGTTHAGKWQIMPLGDSITGTTCYPKLLAQELISKGHASFDFVGTVQNNQGCGSAANVQTEGHGGYLVTYLMTDSPPQGGKGTLSELKTWAAEKPDVVLMEYGTNDAWSSIATSEILKAYGFVVDQFRAQNAGVIFFVAQITPLNPSGCASCEANVEALNAQIPTWAGGKTTAASPVYVVDVWASLPAATFTPNSTYTTDGAHPNPAGSQLMADAWYAGLTAKGIP